VVEAAVSEVVGALPVAAPVVVEAAVDSAAGAWVHTLPAPPHEESMSTTVAARSARRILFPLWVSGAGKR
jgi:hypothetical protein